jgi:hypothetical protein
MTLINILIVASLAYLLEATLAIILFIIFRKRIIRRVAYILDGERDISNINDCDPTSQCECGSEKDCGCMPAQDAIEYDPCFDCDPCDHCDRGTCKGCKKEHH